MSIRSCSIRHTLGRSLVVASVLTTPLLAQSASKPTAASPLGMWRGTSRCLVRPSPCNDEVVVYRITPTHAADSVSMDAHKLVNGVEEEMGVLGCHYTAASGALACALPRGTWEFRVRRDSLVGELLLTDRTKFRDVRTVRVP